MNHKPTSELFDYIFDLFRGKAKFPDNVDPELRTPLYYPMSRFLLASTILSKQFLANPTKENFMEIIENLCEEDEHASEWLKNATTQKKAVLFFTYGEMKKE